jgi:hypothetical protein
MEMATGHELHSSHRAIHGDWPGDESDPTRAPAFHDDAYQCLTGLGIAEV